MRRFYCPSCNITQSQATIIDASQVHHIKDVLRIKAGAKIALFDDEQKEYSGLVKQVSQQKIIIAIERQEQAKSDEKTICLAVALPKRAKFDFIVEKLCELGVDTIAPLISRHTVVRPAKDKQEKMFIRWQKISLGASQQAKRRTLARILPIGDFEAGLSLIKDFDLALIACLNVRAIPLKEALRDFSAQSIIVFIGPEGDFACREVELALKSGCIPVSLGALTLKVDTACLFVLSILRYALS